MFTVKTPHEGEGFDVVVLDAESGALNLAEMSENRNDGMSLICPMVCSSNSVFRKDEDHERSLMPIRLDARLSSGSYAG